MYRANLKGPYKIEIEEAAKPKISNNDVLLQIHSVGICGSDVQMYHGLHKYMSYPVVIGHEAGASVREVGAAVTAYAVGDRVTVEPQVFCGECYPCKIGRFNVCEHLRVMGVHKDGMACEYFAVDQRYLHKCPSDMPFQRIALVEPTAVAIGSVKRVGDISGKNVVVVGAGTIGNLTAQAAKALGAGQVMITDLVDEKLKIAEKCGVDRAVNTNNVSLKEVICEAFGARKADVIIDAAATRGSFLSILDAARPSSKIVVTGNYKKPMELELPVIQRQEIELIGHMMYVREDFIKAIELLSDGRINGGQVVSAEFSLREVSDAFRYIEEHSFSVVKVILRV